MTGARRAFLRRAAVLPLLFMQSVGGQAQASPWLWARLVAAAVRLLRLTRTTSAGRHSSVTASIGKETRAAAAPVLVLPEPTLELQRRLAARLLLEEARRAARRDVDDELRRQRVDLDRADRERFIDNVLSVPGRLARASDVREFVEHFADDRFSTADARRHLARCPPCRRVHDDLVEGTRLGYAADQDEAPAAAGGERAFIQL